MKTQILIALLALTLAACAPAQANATDLQNTDAAVVQTGVALTQAALPTATPMPPTFTPTQEATFAPATVMPTQAPPPILTPDATQVERWQEYQTELAKALFVYNPSFPLWEYGPAAYTDALCEWDILGQSNQEVYFWAACISADGLSLRTNPVVIYLEPDGSIRKVNIPSVEVNRHDQTVTYDLHPFPTEVQVKLCLYYFYGFVPQCHNVTHAYIPSFDIRREGVFLSHLEYRESHAEEPPLVVLSAAP